MIVPSAPAVDAIWLRYVIEPAARALVLGGAAWLLLSAFRAREITLRLAVWTTILYAALAMPLLSRIVPQIPLPILSAQTAGRTIGDFAAWKTATSEPSRNSALLQPRTAGAAANQKQGPEAAGLAAWKWVVRAAADVSWPSAVMILYLCVAAILVVRFVFGWAAGFRLRRGGSPIQDEGLQQLLAREARDAGLKKLPRLAENAAISVPATLGLWEPAILLPPEWTDWTESQIGVVLAHELSHIARRDGLTRALSRLHRAIFWFSPLSWWLDRELAELAEQASDDAALRSGADRARYAEVLLHFFGALKAARGRIRWEGVSMAQGSRSVRRLERILDDSTLSRGLGRAALVALALAAVPLICLAAALRPSPAYSVPTPQAAAPPPAPALALTQASLPGAAIAADARPSARPIPVDAARGNNGTASSACPGDFAFAIVSGRSGISECVSTADLHRVWTLRREIYGSFLWFRENGRSYVVDNPAIVKASLGVFVPLRTIEWKQAALDRQESQLLRERLQLGILQMAANFQELNFQLQMRGLETQFGAAQSPASSQQWNPAQPALVQAQWNAMQNSMAALEFIALKDRQAARRQNAAFYTQQDALFRRQAELDEQQAELARQALLVVRSLIDRSLLRGSV